MCTLILASRHFDDSPVFLASNRDEKFDRPASGPMIWAEDSPAFVAPRDELAGGTWAGANARGVVAAITNRFGDARDPERRSRGELVIDALRQNNAAAAADCAEAVKPTDFNAFHLLVADADSAHVIWSDGVKLYREDLGPGLWVVTERSFGAAPNGRATFLRSQIEARLELGTLDRNALVKLLAIGRVNDPDATCVLLPDYGFGTRSSLLVDVGETPQLAYADGPPCEVDYFDYTGLLTEVLDADRG